ncbi:hypothetical protein X769_10040 [Mesorhizobium sp. LSJC268A00]|uniref:hypothetical protein n=1 Tax=unclassified Mesorhizobium TaxID=325217 RepID=UPI0003CE5C02|nr:MULTISPECIES: hypothetical protein [unclassified Mesorhizobium]ESX07303.1 hypothetical protein X769_10040 [Mesorhizobium sp. LSJC268A00]ESZ17558.1 hypothetical protein X735_01845 [Mesorhizobium sp. L2C085B000]
MAIGSIFHFEQNAPDAIALEATAGRPHGIYGSPVAGAKYKQKQGPTQMDIVVIGIEVLFFGLSLAYIKACDAL